MLRSASTWSYNVCRLLLESQSMEFQGGFVGEGAEVDDFIKKHDLDHQHLLIKSHQPGPRSIQYITDEKAYSIYTYRDPRDSLCSGMQFSGIDFSTLLIDGVRNLHALNFYQDKSLFVKFDHVKINPIQEIERISLYLGFRLQDSVYKSIAVKTSLESSKKVILDLKSSQSNKVFQVGTHMIDRRTLLHLNHIGSAKIGRWQDDLDSEQQLLVNAIFKRWLIDLEFEQYESINSVIQTLVETVNWEELVQRYLHDQQYLLAGKLCESVIHIFPDSDLGYWYLGLSLFLASNEEKAKATWMERLSEIRVLDVSNALDKLIDILIEESKHWESKSSIHTAYSLRVCVEEINPTHLQNKLHVIQLALQLNKFDVSDLQTLNIMEYVAEIAENPIAGKMLANLQEYLSLKFPDNLLVKEFKESVALILSKNV